MALVPTPTPVPTPLTAVPWWEPGVLNPFTVAASPEFLFACAQIVPVFLIVLVVDMIAITASNFERDRVRWALTLITLFSQVALEVSLLWNAAAPNPRQPVSAGTVLIGVAAVAGMTVLTTVMRATRQERPLPGIRKGRILTARPRVRPSRLMRRRPISSAPSRRART